MILVWLLEVVAAGWLIGVRDPGAYAVMLAVGLVIGLVMRTDRGAMVNVSGFGAGIVAILFAWYVAEHDLAGQGVIAAVGIAGMAVIAGSLARHNAGR